MSQGRRQTAEITLMGQKFVVSCAPGEEDDLHRAAHYLDQVMNGIQARGRTISIDKVAMMAGLNISHELLRESERRRELEDGIERLNERLEKALEEKALARRS